jgi:hypothetical protein
MLTPLFVHLMLTPLFVHLMLHLMHLLPLSGANFGPPCPAPCPWVNRAELHELLEDANTNRRRLKGEEASFSASSAARRLNTPTPKIYVMDHTKCAVFSHTRMKCIMPEGAGAAFKVVLTIGR